MPVINEKGNRYGKLLVLERAENNKRGEAQWLCQCDCGNQTIVKGVSLRTGHTQSCGCLQKEAVRQTGYNNAFDLVGKRFNKLEVIERVPGNKNKTGKWKCKCDCGNFTIVSTYNLINSITKSCGCLKLSAGEIAIDDYLTRHKYNFSREYSFADLKRVQPLRFDFAIFNSSNQLELLIEYDGLQHSYEKNGYYNEKTIENDKAKDDYCKKHNIPLYRIGYYDDIEKRLQQILKSYNF